MILPCLLALCLSLPLPQEPAAGRSPFLASNPSGPPATTQLAGVPPGLGEAVDHSLAFLAQPAAATWYAQLKTPGFTVGRVRRSLERFRELLRDQGTSPGFLEAVRREFDFQQVAGDDGAGSILFTGYFEPTYEASRKPTAVFRYPLYRRPKDFQAWPKPQPTRLALVGPDGLQGARGPLKALELVWIKDRFLAFLVEVQGSARLRLTDGTTMTVGNDGIIDHPYVSIGKLMAAEQHLKPADVTLPALTAYFDTHPGALDAYLSRCDRLVFFRDTQGGPPMGCLSVPVTALCSVATDKELFPPGALALIEVPLPGPDGSHDFKTVQRFVLDQDSGGPIKGPWRFDYFLGAGPEAGTAAGLMNRRGKAWYLMLKEPAPPKP